MPGLCALRGVGVGVALSVVLSVCSLHARGLVAATIHPIRVTLVAVTSLTDHGL